MRIVYIGRHDQPTGNDDEGSVTFALEQLGHNVFRLNEEKARKAHRIEADLLLFNKWLDPDYLRAVKIPKVFWYWDRVESGDPTLERRDHQRVSWMQQVMPLVDLGFCSDGDWVEKVNGLEDHRSGGDGKMVWLPQGADERVVGAGVKCHQGRCPTCASEVSDIDVLFTGISKGGGTKRQSFVAELADRYGNRFRHVERGVHGRDMANLVASSKIVVAPDFPVSDRYWSNRVFNVLGFGGFLLHPWCKGLLHCYDESACVFYHCRKELFEQIDWFLCKPDTRKYIAAWGLEQTTAKNLYRHRCEELIRVVKERLL